MSTANPRPLTVNLSDAFERVIRTVLGSVQALAFWTATLLPLVLVAGLFTGAVDQQLSTIGGAAAANVALAVLGHGHSPA